MSTGGFRPAISAFLAHPSAQTRRSLGDEVAGTGITIIGESGNGRDALEQILELLPDVALIAVDLPDLSGSDVCRAIHDRLPACPVLLLAEHDDDEAYGGLAAGAYGCYLLSDPPLSLVRAIRGTMRRESLPTAEWARRMLGEYQELAANEDERVVPAPRLTPTEAEVLKRMAEGKTPDEIAEQHDVTSHLVRLHAGYAIVKLYRSVSDEAIVRAAS